MKTKLVIPVVLLMITWGIFTYINKQKVQKRADIIQMSWADHRKDKLVSIISTIYRDTNEVSYILQKSQGTWQLVEPFSSTIFVDKAIILANGFLTLTPSEEITDITKEEIVSYGLDKPTFKIQGVFDSETNGFIIGKPTAVGGQYYIQDLNNTDVVYIIEEQKLIPFIQGVSTLINNYFVTQSTDDIVYVSFQNMLQEKILITNSNHFWTIDDTPADWGTKRFLLALKELSFDARTINFDTSNESFSNFGINKETSPQISLVFNDGTTNTLMVGLSNINKAYPIYLSKENMIAYSSESGIQDIFSTIRQDFQIQK